MMGVVGNEDTCEVISSEDLAAQVDDFNDKIRKGEVKEPRLTVGSLDVSGLYPAIDVIQAGIICRQEFIA